MKNKPPCKDCTSRYLGCHDKCENYIAFREERDELLELKKHNNEMQDMINDYKQRNCHKAFIKNGKRGRI